MSTYSPLNFNLGETWTIKCDLNYQNSPLLMSLVSTITWTLYSDTGVVLVRSLADSGIGIDNPPGLDGKCTVVVPVAMQTSIVENTIFSHELMVVLNDGTVSIQSSGPVTFKTLPSFIYSSS